MPAPRAVAFAAALAAAAAAPAPAAAQSLLAPPDPRAALVRDLDAVIGRELADKHLPAVWLAVLDIDRDRGSEWSRAFARGDLRPGAPAGVDDVLRVASISKLVTALLIAGAAERHELGVDDPVRRWLPHFLPRDPRGADITLRHLLQHRAGLSRDCPVGHWFDATAPGLAATVASIDDTELLFDPGTAMSYSSPGYAVLGRVLEIATGTPFAALADQRVLTPLGLADSSFDARPDLVARTVTGAMWTLDGRAIPTPTHQFGCGPALNLRSTASDLLRLAGSWFAGADAGVDPATLEAMWQPGEGGIGLGFFVRDLDGARAVGHSGTAPGMAIELLALPDEGLAVAAAVALDYANDLAEAFALRALRDLRAARHGEAPPPLAPWPRPVGAAAAQRAAGRYAAGDEWFDLLARGDDVVFDPCIGVATVQRGRSDRDGWIADDRLCCGRRTLYPIDENAVNDGFSVFRRVPETPPPPAPAELLPLLGEYGWHHGGLIAYEDHGRLGVLLGWHVRELPDPDGPDRWRMPPGSYGGETLRFVRDGDGRVTHAVFCNVAMPRRPDPDPRGFRIRAVRAVRELRQLARSARPPAQPADLLPPDLVPLAGLSPTLRFDIRYATADNFLGEPVYERAAPMLQRPAAAALLRAHELLAERGYGLLVHDAYRPWSITKVFWDATPPELHDFVADPSRGSRHNRGCAVDLTLYDLATGEPVVMPSGYDEFTARAYPDWPGGSERQRWYRELLRSTMTACGFAVYEYEWWHFDYRDWQRYPVLDQPLR